MEVDKHFLDSGLQLSLLDMGNNTHYLQKLNMEKYFLDKHLVYLDLE